ncbi:MAG TPA: Lrp/AsnC family transcriptional regulator [Candidatus Nanoarchaeia archaeon]|nr:Lrp/AsnC family transcriptional regulator [Candidatus Nanoarchaeia archaeon]
MIDKKQVIIISNLRRNARESLTRLSKKTSIPVSTIFEKLKVYESTIIKKHTCLINFASLGYNTTANIFLKVSKIDKEKVKDYLTISKSLNSVYRVNNNYDFMAEAIFKDMKEAELFLEEIENKFDIQDKYVSYIIDEIKKEDFMSNPEYLKIINRE